MKETQTIDGKTLAKVLAVTGGIWPVETDDIEQYTLTIEKLSTGRTQPLRGAQHIYFKQMADSLNDAGYDQKAVMEKVKHDMKIPNTLYSIKDLFRAIGVQMHGKTSTEKLTNSETKKTYEAFDRGMSMKFGVRHEWPCKELQDAESQGLRK